MEVALQRYTWPLSLVAAVIAAWLCARTINTFAGAALAPKPALVAAGAAAPTLPLSARA